MRVSRKRALRLKMFAFIRPAALQQVGSVPKRSYNYEDDFSRSHRFGSTQHGRASPRI
jgi:hypothetical protein